QPRFTARSAAAVASRVLPMPPSPTMKTERPVPLAAGSTVFERSASSSLRPTSGAAAPSRVSMGPMYERQFTGARLGANVATRDDMPPADLRTLADPLYDTKRDHQP